MRIIHRVREHYPTFNAANGAIITATLTGNITVTLTAGTYKGQTLELRLTQDGTGSRVATWPRSLDSVTMRFDGTNWIEVSRALNVS